MSKEKAVKNGDKKEIPKEIKRDFHSYYFIVSHPKSLNDQALYKLKTKHPSIQPLRKLLERDFKSPDGQQYFVVCVYGGDIIPSLLKEKEIILIKDNVKIFTIKLAQKTKKNKFYGKISVHLDFDCFINFVRFDPIKKLIGKNIDPPPQIELKPFEYFSLFSEVLITKERKKITDNTYLELLRFGMELLKMSETVPFKLFLLIYEKILNTENIPLLDAILDYFHIKKIEQPKNLEELDIYHEALMLIYEDSNKFVENIKKIPNVNFEKYLIKFYTVNIFYYSTLKEDKKIESFLLDLRDNNPYDKLILAKLYLSEFNNFYRNIPITQEIKLSLIDCYIQASSTYENLTTAFSMITEYIQSDFNTMLLIIIKNYEKINQICSDSNKSLEINDYIILKYDDDLTKVKNSMDIIGKNKLDCGFRAIHFRITMWDIYLSDGKNPEFLEFLKSYLIQSSLYLQEIVEALDYIIKYTNKNFVTMLELLVKNYDKLEGICMIEKKYINVINYITNDASDNFEDIKKNFDFIIYRKLKANYETLLFKIEIWLFYILNKFNNEFLLYLEKKLFEGALYYEDILDCLTYAVTLRNYQFVPILEVIIKNFEKIHIFIESKKTSVDISKYFKPEINSDNLEEIYKLIKVIIANESKKNYRTINFKIDIWKPYSNLQNLDALRFIRKIIIECYKMDKTLTERTLDLGRKIHDVGFLYIRQGKLTGDKLLEFLGIEEAFYVEGQINDIIETNKYQQRQLDEHLANINYLLKENEALKRRVSDCETEINNLKIENAELRARMSSLESEVSSLFSKVRSLESDVTYIRNRRANENY